MGRSPDVTVVVPVYNRARIVARALDSVFCQGVESLEVIVVDDGSSDNLGGTVAAWGTGRVRYVRHERNLGAAAARNTGIRESRGRYVAFLDSDDEWLPGKLVRQLEQLDQKGGPRLSGTGFHLIRGDVETQTRIPNVGWIDREYLAFGCGFAPGSTMVARRECFDAVGLFDTEFPRLEDWDWLLRATKRDAVAIVSEPFARIYQNSPPPLEQVLVSVDRLVQRHESEIAAESWRAGRKFNAAVSIERAATCYRHHRRFTALAHFARSFYYYPFREKGYIRRILRGIFYCRRFDKHERQRSSQPTHSVQPEPR